MIKKLIYKIILIILGLVGIIGGGYFGYKKLYQEPKEQEAQSLEQQKKIQEKKRQKEIERQKKAEIRRQKEEARKKAAEEQKKREEAKRAETEKKGKETEEKPLSMEDLFRKTLLSSKEPPPYAYHDPSTIDEKLDDYFYSLEIINWYKKALENPTKDNNALFYGAPGTGKTSLARILAKNANKPFFEVKGDDLYAQQHEKREPREKLVALLTDIEEGKFSGLKGDNKEIDISQGYILFIDEANAMEKETVFKGRKLGFLKNMYDAFDKHQENKKVLTILATNFIDDLDLGLFREGRFPKLSFNFTLPLLWNIIEKEGIDYGVILPSDLPRISHAGNKTIELVNKFGIATLRKFMQFWAKGQLSRKFSNDEKKFRPQFRKVLAKFWEKEESGQLDSYLNQGSIPLPPWEEVKSDSESEDEKKKKKK